VGRIPVITTLESLDEASLVRILIEPKNSLVKQYSKLLEMDGVGLSFDDDALEQIAKIAIERKTGARGLRSIMEKALEDTMYQVPSEHTISSVNITRDVVLKMGEPEFEHDDSRKPRQLKLAVPEHKRDGRERTPSA
jgi:ATP-dependent Clp protease ATP-binding subunit ClpX